MLKKIKKDQSGIVEMTSFVMLSWLVIMLALAGLDIFLMSSRFITVSNIAQQTMEMIKDDGYFSEDIKNIFFHELELQNVGTQHVTIHGYTDYEDHVDRGDPVYFQLTVRYTLISFRPLGLSEEALTIDWGLNKVGISRRFVRPF